jgi:large subunit ribosomal protein L15
MQLHTIQRGDGRVPTKVRVGRGGKRGKTCGHGHKGQKQHGRHGIRPEMRDFIKKLPKLRGFGKNRARTVNSDGSKVSVVALSKLNIFKSGDTVSPKTLVEAGIVELQGGKLPKVKILAGGEITTKINIEDCSVSTSVKQSIEQAGGSIK